MTPHLNRRTLLAGALATTATALAGCSGAAPETAAPSPGATASGIDWTRKGPITYAQGKDTSNYVPQAIQRWNDAHPDEKVTFVELPNEADQQRQRLLDNANTRGSAGYDVISVDIVWTAEFAANRYVVELPPDQFPTAGYLKPAVDGCSYFNKLYCFPTNGNGALLYYRKDLLDEVGAKVPTTWAELAETGRKIKAKHPDVEIYAGQFQKYEGLTCNFAEWINGAGGLILDDAGKPVVTSEAAVRGVQAMANWFADGTIPAAASTWMEENSRQAFQDGRLAFLRNWPYVYTLAGKTDGSSKIVGKFGIAPLPGLDGLGTSTMGGNNMAIVPTAKNPGTCRDFILWFNAEAQQKANLQTASQAPTLESLYRDPELTRQFGYLTTLYEATGKARPRPKSVRYGDVTLAIQDAAYRIVQRPTEPVRPVLAELQGKLATLVQ